jgi:hypothetical protein
LEFAITKDRDSIGDRLDFGEPVAYVNDCDAVLFPLMNFLEEDFRLWEA